MIKQLKRFPLLRSSWIQINKIINPMNVALQARKARFSNRWVPAGHYYSPLPNIRDMKRLEHTIWPGDVPLSLYGIDLNLNAQLQLAQEFIAYYDDLHLPIERTEKFRYFGTNDMYSLSDAFFLASMMRYFKPKKIIEAGSGFSTCLMLDINERYFDNSIDITCIEPYPARLLRNIRRNDKINLLQNRLQDVPQSLFDSLQKGDFLFIDTTHVAKTGSDVNRIIFEIFPLLNKGVIVHIHDIFYPFEYPKEWVMQGRGWNECYMLRAFLQSNQTFQIIFFTDYLIKTRRDFFEAHFPLYLQYGVGSIWLEKTL